MKVYMTQQQIDDLKQDTSGTVVWYNADLSNIKGGMIGKYHDMEIYPDGHTDAA